LELKKPATAPAVVPLRPNVRVLAVAPAMAEVTASPGLPYEALWNSFFARLLLSFLAVALPFLIIAGLIPDLLAKWGVGPQILAIGVLIGVTALTARLMIRPLRALSSAAARAEAGDLSVRVLPSGSTEVRLVGHAFNSMLEQLAGIQLRVRGEVAAASGQLAQASQELASATQEQTMAATQTSASMEELSRSAVSIAGNVASVTNQASDIRARIAGAQTELLVSAERVHSLSERVGEIEGILVLINDIADETNLLALNAAIEAARAGESGRGFAVVADEVRRLAERSKAAAAQIGTLVGAAQVGARATVTAVEDRGRQMEVWLSMMVKMADASGQVQLATEDQRSAVDRAVEAMEQIAASSRSVSQTAKEIALAAARQGEIATELAGSSGRGTAVRGE
jgi:methyl-accepting chemotaxis protein